MGLLWETVSDLEEGEDSDDNQVTAVRATFSYARMVLGGACERLDREGREEKDGEGPADGGDGGERSAAVGDNAGDGETDGRCQSSR